MYRFECLSSFAGAIRLSFACPFKQKRCQKRKIPGHRPINKEYPLHIKLLEKRRIDEQRKFPAQGRQGTATEQRRLTGTPRHISLKKRFFRSTNEKNAAKADKKRFSLKQGVMDKIGMPGFSAGGSEFRPIRQPAGMFQYETNSTGSGPKAAR